MRIEFVLGENANYPNDPNISNDPNDPSNL